MAGKKGSRSSKTAHVLNLLSGGEAPEAPEQRPAAGTERTEEPQAGPTPPPPPRERPILPPIVEVARTNSEALSETIRSALEKELGECYARTGGGEGGALCQNVWPVPLSPLCGGCEGAGPHPAAGQICGSARRA